MKCGNLFDYSKNCDVVAYNNSCCNEISQGYGFCQSNNDVIDFTYCNESAAAKDVENFLQNFTFTIQKFVSCQNSCKNALREIEESNGQFCIATNIDIFFETDFCSNNITDKCKTNNDDLVEILINFPPLFFIFGILAIMGNFGIIFAKVRFFFYKFTLKEKERVIFYFLILNLAISDLLMGLSNIIYASEILHLAQDGKQHIHNVKCNMLGIFVLLSNQISISLLVLISGYRLISVTRPFKRVHLKTTVILVVFIWIVWVFLALLPVFEPLSVSFVDGFYVHEYTRTDFISLSKIRGFVDNIINKTNVTGCFLNVLKVIKNSKGHHVPKNFLEKLNLTTGVIEHQGFYNKHPVLCIASPVVKPSSVSFFVTIFFLSVDLVAMLFIVGAYGAILKILLKQQSFQTTVFGLFGCARQEREKRTINRRQLNQNKKLYRSILFIVVTNLFAWIPTLIAALTYYGAAFAYKQPIENFIIPYQLFVYIAFPVNSVMNPFLYSSKMWSKFFKNLKKKLTN